MQGLILSKLWVIFHTDGWDGVENALSEAAQSPSSSGRYLLAAKGLARPPRSPMPNAGPGHWNTLE